MGDRQCPHCGGGPFVPAVHVGDGRPMRKCKECGRAFLAYDPEAVDYAAKHAPEAATLRLPGFDAEPQP